MVAAKIANVAKDVLLAPVYLYQGRKVKRDTVRLPEPDGDRYGHIKLNPEKNVAINVDKMTAANQKTLSLMIVGDSAAAGVGSQTQQEALAGKLIPALQQQALIDEQFNTKFDEISWSLQATTGHTSFDILRRLYILPAPSASVDVMVLSVGVNDTTANVSPAKWQQQIEEIITIAQRKFGVGTLIFSRLPQMAQMPALPAPLNGFIGAKADKLDKILQQVCAEHIGVTYMATDFARMIDDHANGTPIDISVMFASDGFHPSSLMYGYWAQQLAELIAKLVDN
ncbi:SGNH/GDSL hydrolase family protein [Psychrobacter frigidicola]|uniref:SGNH/GDSL hydrolase family protein n=1 Tax=Psychrobacter frigidicola TaxID=45611 RepID=A0A5C6ZZS6_9GAMM|nr:SGNH/GDSL hydrolase family protein [Psychrobacter frigidicola]TXD96044.1 SGNH/GDSL hydrolase family protein [Psychrobacter frigidicola]